ncbi:hypothetical protein SAMN05428964_10960 [Thalassospira xiamenensis]|uniref:HNH endonuclease n=2 Tax=Thalassospira xiamenensis TaxID=220697 RepID=A0A285TY48_9PROT|nr:hypothetical protein SAMN05428964_10960 [Thalassospira xiamenensis]
MVNNSTSTAFISVTLKSLGMLADQAAKPGRLELSSLIRKAKSIQSRMKEAKAVCVAASIKVKRYRMVPFYGARLKRDYATKVRRYQELQAELKLLALRAQNEQFTIEQSRTIRKNLLKAYQASRGKPFGLTAAKEVAELDKRAQFLQDTLGKEMQSPEALIAKLLGLSQIAIQISQSTSEAEPLNIDYTHVDNAEPVRFNRPVVKSKSKSAQLALDFDGTGQVEEEERIWLPVSVSRTHEVRQLGANLDASAPRRGSQLWVPVSQRHKVEHLLPLAFRREATQFEFPPIRHNAVGQNLWSVFDKDTWNHIRTTAYDRAGHRCQICGKQGGSLYSRISTAEELKRGGVVDCHEVWEWEPSADDARKGVQRLKRLLVVCKDCHMMFHEGFALWKATEAGVDRSKAATYIKNLRMLVNRCNSATLESQLADANEAWTQNKQVEEWVIDLSHLANQDYMADRTITLSSDNKAGIGPDQIAGISFRTEDGVLHSPTTAESLLRSAEAQMPLFGRGAG